MKQSKLQRRIMLNLPTENITSLAESIGVFRSSASRCLHYLQSLGLVNNNGIWQLTSEGKTYLEKISKPTRFELAKDIGWIWGNGDCCFNCPCGIEQFILLEGDEKQCECGRIYRIVYKVEVSESKTSR